MTTASGTTRRVQHASKRRQGCCDEPGEFHFRITDELARVVYVVLHGGAEVSMVLCRACMLVFVLVISRYVPDY